MNATEFQQNKLSLLWHIRRAKYFVSMQEGDFKYVIRHIRKLKYDYNVHRANNSYGINTPDRIT